MILLWLAVAAVASPLAARLAGTQQNDSALFLPSQAEATRVLKQLPAFESSAVLPAIVVYERGSGLTAADRDLVVAQARDMASIKGVVGRPSPPIASDDGRALEVVVPLDGAKFESINVGVDRLRKIVRGSNGLSAHVAGPAGLAADFGAAFKALDVKLLAGTTIVVVAVLLVVYRSPFLWLIPLLSVGFSLLLAQALVYLAGKQGWFSSNGQSQGILTVLVFGAGTDYALLIISRYREELRRHLSAPAAIQATLKGTAPAVLASGSTVILSLLCLLLAADGANRSLGPTAAIGIACAMASMLTLLPAVLLLFGRRLFWPLVPRFGSQPEFRAGIWHRIAGLVGHRARPAWIVATVVLGALALGITQLSASGIPGVDQYTVSVDSVSGQHIIERHFAAAVGSPAIIIGNAAQAGAITAAVRAIRGVADVSALAQSPAAGAPTRVVAGKALINATLAGSADSPDAVRTVEQIRTAVHGLAAADALVGGATAVRLDTTAAAQHDRVVIIPIVLAVVLVVLVVLLRALLAPVLLIATVVLSFAATLGVSGFFFSHVFKFAGADASFPLTTFVFLVALGIDYNIFLMSRVREEARREGTRPGILAGLAFTGSVITSAGVVLAATFAVFGVLPLVIFAELGFAVAFGVLLDTLLVRTVLVPALSHDLGRAIWWPFHLPSDRAPETAGQAAALVAPQP